MASARNLFTEWEAKYSSVGENATTCFSFDRITPLGYNCDPSMSCAGTGTITSCAPCENRDYLENPGGKTAVWCFTRCCAKM